MAPVRVAIVNTSEDFIAVLSDVLRDAGHEVCATTLARLLRTGAVSYEDLLCDCRPQVVVFDIALPYETNWKLFQQLRATGDAAGARFVLTTTNARVVRELLGAEAMEIVGKPSDLDALLDAVKRAAGS